SNSAPRSSPNPLDLVAQPLQLGDDSLPLVALNLDPPVLDRPTRPAPLLEGGGEFFQAVFVHGHVENRRHALPSPACRLPPDFHGDGLLGRLVGCLAYGFGGRFRGRRYPTPA